MKTLKPTRAWHIMYCTTGRFKHLTIIILFWIIAIDVERYIGFLYVNMKILIYILKFKHLRIFM